MGYARKPVHIAGQDFADAINRCGLPLKLDTPTQGDGNCWVRAVQQQLERPDMVDQLNSRTRQVMSVRKQDRYLVLKKSVAEFAITSQHPTIRRAKERFENEGQGAADGVTWKSQWNKLARDRQWSDGLMVQATAWFIGHDIQLVMTTSTPEEPFRIIRGNLKDPEKDSPGHPLWIGYQNSIHYQSLLLTDDEVAYQPPEQEAQGDKAVESEENKKPGDKIPTQIKEKQADRISGEEEVERKKMNKKPGDKIPTKIKEKKADMIKGGAEVEKPEGNKKPGDEIPQKIKEKQIAKTDGGEAVEREEMNKKPGDKIPTQVKKKPTARSKDVEEVETGEKSQKPGDKIPNQNTEKHVLVTQGEDKKSINQKCDSVLNGEKAFVFQDNNNIYRFLQTPTGYKCPICKMEFARIGQHISTKQCGDAINVDQFKEALKKYQQKMRNLKYKEKDPETFAEKHRTQTVKLDHKKKEENPKTFAQKKEKV